MKIKEFSIVWYGPLPSSDRISLTDFNLFWGKNEDGKTLTIEALIKLLLGKRVKYFDNVDRVEDNPQGYVIIGGDDGREFKLPDKGSLTDLTGLTPLLCRNIFIIRNSDLSLDREKEFYTKLTDRLTGLRTEKIMAIKKKLQEIGKLTRADSQADFSDSQDFGKIKSRLEEAKVLIVKIENLEQAVKAENYDRLEEDYVSQEQELKKLSLYLEDLEKARKRESYEKGKNALQMLKQALAKFKALDVFDEEGESRWQRCQQDLKSLSKEKENLQKEVNHQQQELKTIEKKLKEIKKVFQVLKTRKVHLDEIRLQLTDYCRRREGLAQKEGKSKLALFLAPLTLLLTGISLVGIIVQPIFIFYFLVVIFGLSSLVGWFYYFNFIRKKDLLSRQLEKLRTELARFGLSSDSLEGILFNLQKFEEEFKQVSEEVQELEMGKGILIRKIDELRQQNIPAIEAKINQAREIIDELKMKSGLKTLSQYSEKLKIKQEQKRILASQQSVLENFFEAEQAPLERSVLYWEKEIKRMERYKDQAKDLRYDEETETELKKKIEITKKSLEETKEKLKSIQQQLSEIEREANRILQMDDEYLYCQTSVDLEAVKSKLFEFIEENEKRKQAVLAALRIFEDVEKEEREKVAQLFGRQSPVTAYFNKITGGIYQEVSFNQDSSRIQVQLKNGQVLETNQLSAGTYDQLYFSIRLALGEKLLNKNKGFFILDDPFVKADPIRLKSQLEMLKEISRLGWQVLYFSAKGEIKESLKEDIQQGKVNLIEIKSIY